MTTDIRNYSTFDKAIQFIDSLLPITTTNHKQDNQRFSPADIISEDNLTSSEKRQSISMMRVDHSGEICAQALYMGQALTARKPNLKAHLQQAAKEEQAHLTWCHCRIKDLGGKASLLNPIWGFGAFTIGSIAGLTGDKWSLGFLAETEKQVTKHIDTQLNVLSANDHKTRAILEQMREDECQHADGAINLGGQELPSAIKRLMKYSAKVMTTTAKYI